MLQWAGCAGIIAGMEKSSEKSGKVAHEPRFSDSSTTVESLKGLVEQFVTARNWGGYHTPKNVAVSIAIEAAELLEHFQWHHPEADSLTGEQKLEIEDEMADVLAYLLSLANVLGTDISVALTRKMKKNGLKYPVEQFYGRWKKPVESGSEDEG